MREANLERPVMDPEDFLETTWLHTTGRSAGEQLHRLFRRSELRSGEILLQEGHRNERLWLVESGTLQVVKTGTLGLAEIAKVGLGATVGDLSFLDGEPASATVQAMGTAVVWSVERKQLSLVELSEVMQYLSTMNADRMRTRTTELVASMERTVAAAKLAMLVVALFSLQIVLTTAARDRGLAVDAELFRWGSLLIFLVPVVLFARSLGVAPSDLGLTMRGWKVSILEACAVAVPVCIGIWLLLPLVQQPFPVPTVRQLATVAVPYAMHSFLQEFACRGVVQGTVVRLMGREHEVLVITVVSVSFAVAHLHLGLVTMVATGIASLVFGLLYARHSTLVGVASLHVALGITMTALGYLAL